MAKIETTTDIIKWAEGVVEANGDRFTPLSKGEQFLIAQYILNISSDTTAESESKERDGKETIDTLQKPNTNKEEKCGGESEKVSAEEIPPTIKMSRGAAFHLAGLTAQNSYDEYLKWLKDHPTEKEVMDFSTGRKSSDAAYAYWLAEVINVHFKDKEE